MERQYFYVIVQEQEPPKRVSDRQKQWCNIVNDSCFYALRCHRRNHRLRGGAMERIATQQRGALQVRVSLRNQPMHYIA